MQPQAASIRSDPAGRCPASNSHKFESAFFSEKAKTPQPSGCGVAVVDDTRLELVTSRTSSGCATSCANRPSLKQVVFYTMRAEKSRTFFLNPKFIFPTPSNRALKPAAALVNPTHNTAALARQKSHTQHEIPHITRKYLPRRVPRQVFYVNYTSQFVIICSHSSRR